MRGAHPDQEFARAALFSDILIDLDVRYLINGVAVARQTLGDASKSNHLILS
jgi:hypothetical protein